MFTRSAVLARISLHHQDLLFVVSHSVSSSKNTETAHMLLMSLLSFNCLILHFEYADEKSCLPYELKNNFLLRKVTYILFSGRSLPSRDFFWSIDLLRYFLTSECLYQPLFVCLLAQPTDLLLISMGTDAPRTNLEFWVLRLQESTDHCWDGDGLLFSKNQLKTIGLSRADTLSTKVNSNGEDT